MSCILNKFINKSSDAILISSECVFFENSEEMEIEPKRVAPDSLGKGFRFEEPAAAVDRERCLTAGASGRMAGEASRGSAPGCPDEVGVIVVIDDPGSMDGIPIRQTRVSLFRCATQE